MITSKFYDPIEEALNSGGEVLLKHFGSITSYEVKQDQSNIVTAADLECEHVILAKLKTHFPTHNFLAEESGLENNDSEYTWIIDPLDGTSNFSAGLPWFGIIISLLKNSKVIAAGILLPVQNDFYYAELGMGAYLNKKAIKVSEESELKNVLFVYSLDYSEETSKTESESKIISSLVQNVRNLRSTNSVLDFCFVADGKMGGVINQSTKIWDIAGPSLLIEEAGGKVSDIHGNKIKFEFSSENLEENYTIVAAPKKLFTDVIALIKN